jgi:biotin operon repressor
MAEPIRMSLDNGAVLEFHDLFWTTSGRLFCKIIGYAPDGSIIGNSKTEMSSGQSRYRVAQEFASHNGARPDIWADALLSAWHTLDAEHHESAEKLLLHSLENEEEPAPQGFVWDPLIPEDFPSNVYGDGGASKSTMMLGLAVSITQGMPFLGLPTTKGPVFYLDWELRESAFLRRLFAVCRGMRLPGRPPDLYYAKLTKPLAHHFADIMDQCERLDPALVILDSLGPAAGADPNDAEAFIKVMQQLRKLERASAIVDHQSKTTGQSYRTKRAIGSGYKDFLVRGGAQLELVESVPGRASIVLRHSKHTFTHEHEPVPFHIHYGIGSIEFELGDLSETSFVDADLLPLPLRIQRVLEETTIPMEIEALAEATGASSKKVLQNAITKLRKKGVKIESGTNSKGETFYSLVTGQG